MNATMARNECMLHKSDANSALDWHNAHPRTNRGTTLQSCTTIFWHSRSIARHPKKLSPRLSGARELHWMGHLSTSRIHLDVQLLCQCFTKSHFCRKIRYFPGHLPTLLLQYQRAKLLGQIIWKTAEINNRAAEFCCPYAQQA